MLRRQLTFPLCRRPERCVHIFELDDWSGVGLKELPPGRNWEAVHARVLDLCSSLGNRKVKVLLQSLL